MGAVASGVQGINSAKGAGKIIGPPSMRIDWVQSCHANMYAV